MRISAPRVDVLVHVYNNEQTIPNCLDSILDQTHKNIVVTIIDDSSTDNSWQVLQRYKAKHSKNIIIKKTTANMGSASGARNECGFGPIGQFWGMIDADDWWIANDKIERQIEKLMTDKTAVACGGTTLQTCSDIADRVGVKSSLERWSFVDYLTGTQNLYVHLSSILWRNIFKGKDGFSPKLIDQGWPRDEWSRTLAGLAESRGWICCVPMPVSQYNFTGIGVWSSLSQSERNERNNLADKKIRAMLPLSYKMFLTLYPKISNSILKLIFLKKIRFRKQLWLLFFNLFRKNT